MATITSIQSGNWGTAGTWDSGVPVNGDTVIIAEGHTVLFDVDQSGFATGLVDLTINGILNFKHDSVTYLKWSGKIQGNGILNVGTDDNPILRAPLGSSTSLATLHFTGEVTTAASAMSGTNKIYLCGWIPETPNYTFIIGNHAIGTTEIHLNDHIDIQEGDEIIIGQETINDWITETPKGRYTVTDYDSVNKVVTINPALASNRLEGDVVAMFTRPITVKSTNKPSAFYQGYFNRAEGALFDQFMFTLYENPPNPSQMPTNYCTYTNSTPFFYIQTYHGYKIKNCTIYSRSSGTQLAKNSCNKLMVENCALISCNSIVNTSANITIIDSVMQNLKSSSRAMYICADITCIDCKIKNAPSLGTNCKHINFYNSEFSNTSMSIPSNAQITDIVESFDHNQIPGNYKAWCKGGTIETDTDLSGDPIRGHLIFNCESADYPVFRDFPMLLAAYKTNRWQALVNKSFTGGEVKIELIDPTSDPLIDSEATPLASYTLPDQADTNLPLKLGYKSDKAMQAILRISATNSEGTVEVDTSLIENRINHGS